MTETSKSQNQNKLPEGWALTHIGKITESIEKIQPKDSPNSEFFYLDIASIDNKINNVTEPKVYLGKDAPSRARQLVQSQDILFSTVRTYLRNIALVPEQYDGEIASTGFSILRGKQGILNKYLFYYVLTDKVIGELSDIQRGTSYPAIRDSDMREQEIPLAPLPEQKRIVAKIEELFTQLDAGVAALKRAQANLKRYKASVLKAACEGRLVPTEASLHPGDYEPANVLLERILEERRDKWEAEHPGKKYKEPARPDVEDLPELPEGWVWARMEQLVNFSQNGFGKRRSNTGTPTIVLRLADVVGQQISLDNVRLVGATDEEIAKYELKSNDLLCIRVNGSLDNVGRMIHINNLGSGIAFCDHFIRFEFSTPKISQFIAMYFDTDRARKFIEMNRVSSAGQNTVSQSTMLTFSVPLPPKAEQSRIMDKMKEIISSADYQEEEIEKSLKRAERLRQAILKRAFEGRLVPQDPADEPASVLLERVKEE